MTAKDLHDLVAPLWAAVPETVPTLVIDGVPRRMMWIDDAASFWYLGTLHRHEAEAIITNAIEEWMLAKKGDLHTCDVRSYQEWLVTAEDGNYCGKGPTRLHALVRLAMCIHEEQAAEPISTTPRRELYQLSGSVREVTVPPLDDDDPVPPYVPECVGVVKLASNSVIQAPPFDVPDDGDGQASADTGQSHATTVPRPAVVLLSELLGDRWDQVDLGVILVDEEGRAAGKLGKRLHTLLGCTTKQEVRAKLEQLLGRAVPLLEAGNSPESPDGSRRATRIITRPLDVIHDLQLDLEASLRSHQETIAELAVYHDALLRIACLPDSSGKTYGSRLHDVGACQQEAEQALRAVLGDAKVDRMWADREAAFVDALNADETEELTR